MIEIIKAYIKFNKYDISNFADTFRIRNNTIEIDYIGGENRVFVISYTDFEFFKNHVFNSEKDKFIEKYFIRYSKDITNDNYTLNNHYTKASNIFDFLNKKKLDKFKEKPKI